MGSSKLGDHHQLSVISFPLSAAQTECRLRRDYSTHGYNSAIYHLWYNRKCIFSKYEITAMGDLGMHSKALA